MEQQISLSENLAEVKSKLDNNPAIGEDPIERQNREAKEKVFSEWIQNIANYNPFDSGE